MTIGGNIAAAAGPIGTGGSVQASLAHPAPMFSYSKSKGEAFHCSPQQSALLTHRHRFTISGLFAGLSLEGTVLIERKDANRDFYGSSIPARAILGGQVPPPEIASRLYEIIEAAEGLEMAADLAPGEPPVVRRLPGAHRRAAPRPGLGLLFDCHELWLHSLPATARVVAPRRV